MNENSKYINAVAKELMTRMSFIPARDGEGEYVLSEELCILEGRHFNGYRVVQLLNGDVWNAAQLQNIFEHNNRWFEAAAGNIYRGALQLVVVVVFHEEGTTEQMDLLMRSQELAVQQYRNITYTAVHMTSRRMTQLTRRPFPIRPVEVILRRWLESGKLEAYTPGELTQMAREEDLQEQRTQRPRKAKATYILMGLNILVWLTGWLMEYTVGRNLLHDYGAKYAPFIVYGEYWRLFTPIFLHADIAHLLGNTFGLYILGPMVESVFGTRKFLAIYFAGGILGNVVSFVFSPNPSLGASGAILGLGGAVLLIWIAKTEVFLRRTGQDVLLVLIVLLDIFYGFTVSGVDNFAHIGGVVGGFFTSAALGYDGSRIGGRRRLLALLAYILAAAGGIAAGLYLWSNVMGM